MNPRPAPTGATERIVASGGAALAVQERGTASDATPTIVLVHGWPDSHHVWDLVAGRLAAEFHVVTYDVRGVGRSTLAPVHRPFTLDKLADDIGAVIEAVSPGRPVHLVGHDWGSVQGWEYVVRPAAGGQLRSFTSLSGPNLDYLGAIARQRARSRQGLGPVGGQAVKSGYTLVLSIPVLRTAMWRLGLPRAFRTWLRASEGIRAADGYPGSGLAADAMAMVPIYRSNIFPKLRRPQARTAQAPVQVVVAQRDRYVSPKLVAEVGEWVPELTVTPVDAGHWSPRTHPDAIARHIAAFAAVNEPA